MQRRGPRVLGPYEDKRRGNWRLFVTGGAGESERRTLVAETRERAERLKEVIESGLEAPPKELTVHGAIEHYEAYLRDDKGNKPRSYQETVGAVLSAPVSPRNRWPQKAHLGQHQTVRRLHRFFPEDRPVASLTPRYCAGRYEALTQEVAVDSHRNYLAECKTFLSWCAEKPRRWLGKNPLAEVKGRGKRKHGKEQLRIDESRLWRDKAYGLAEQGDDGAIAALMTVEMGLRASEITTRVVRDLDNGGAILWIEDGKTDASNAPVEVPVRLRPCLLDLCHGKTPLAPLFPVRNKRSRTGMHWRDWPRENVQRICALAGVPQVTAHGMRGLCATLALLDGASPQEAARRLRHEHESTTLQSYAAPGAAGVARQRRALQVLDGER